MKYLSIFLLNVHTYLTVSKYKFQPSIKKNKLNGPIFSKSVCHSNAHYIHSSFSIEFLNFNFLTKK